MKKKKNQVKDVDDLVLKLYRPQVQVCVVLLEGNKFY